MKKFFFFLLALIAGAGTMMASVPTTISEYSQEGITKGEAMSIPMTYLAFQVGCSSSSYIGVDMYAPSGKNYTIIGTSYTYWADKTYHTYQYFNPASWCYSITTVANGYAFFDLQSVESGVWTLRSVQKYAGEWYYISAQKESNEEEEPIVSNATISQNCEQNGINATLAENFTPQSISANVNGHAYVDLGLPSGNLWATCNLGAQDSTGIGDYYAWGELTTKTSYTNATYQYQDWYGTQAYEYLGDEISETQYDVAKHIYGGDWRFPTAEEAREILTYCTKVAHDNGNEYVGPNGKSIFIPKSGYRQWESVLSSSAPLFWTGTYKPGDDTNYPEANSYAFYGDQGKVQGMCRRFGLPVRPVCSNTSSEASNSCTLTLYAEGCSTPNTYICVVNQEVTINAVPQEDNQFVQWSDGNTDNPRAIVVNSDIELTAQFELIVPPTPQVENAVISQDCDQNGVNASIAIASATEHEYVDLGLPSGLLWATMNIGASGLSNGGDKFAWGEVSPRTTFTRDNYVYLENGAYVNIGNNIAGTQYDAATVLWGDGWKMPTKDQFQELMDNTTEKITEIDGRSCLVLTSKINGNTIIIPSIDIITQYGNQETGFGLFSSTALSTSFAYRAWEWGKMYSYSYSWRWEAYAIRPVHAPMQSSSPSALTHTLTLYADGCDTPNVYVCAAGQEISVTAVPDEDNQFVQWSDGNTDNARIVTLSEDTTLTAIFEPIHMATGLKMIYVNGDSLDNFASDRYAYTLTYPANTAESDLPTVADITWDLGDKYQTVTATQAGTTIVLTVVSGRGLVTTYVLSFVIERPNQYTVTTLSNNVEWGIAIGGNVYNVDADVSIGAFANDGYQFYHWNNTINSNPYTFQLTQDTTFMATFLPNTEEGIIVDVTSTSAHMEWEIKPWGNHGYWIWVYLDRDHKHWYCKMRFTYAGELDKFYWGPASRHCDESEPNHAPVRSKSIVTPDTYFDADAMAISYNLVDIEPATNYFYTLETVDETETAISVIAGTFNTPALTTDIENMSSSVQGGDKSRLILRDGQIFILRGEKVYTLQGQEIE